jgi:hypothetical protein
MKIKEMKNYWVVVSDKGNVMYWTITGTKSESIKAFLQDLSESWLVYQRKYGYRCIKVNINFEPNSKGLVLT